MRIDEWLRSTPEDAERADRTPVDWLLSGAKQLVDTANPFRLSGVQRDVIGGVGGLAVDNLFRPLGRRLLEQPISDRNTIGTALYRQGILPESALGDTGQAINVPYHTLNDFITMNPQIGEGEGSYTQILHNFFRDGMALSAFIGANMDQEAASKRSGTTDYRAGLNLPSISEGMPATLHREWNKKYGTDAPAILGHTAGALGMAGDWLASPDIIFDSMSFAPASIRALRGPIAQRASEVAVRAPEIAEAIHTFGMDPGDIARVGEEALSSFPDLSVRDLTSGTGIRNVQEHMMKVLQAKGFGNSEVAEQVSVQYTDTVIRNAQDLAARNLRVFAPLAVRWNPKLQRTIKRIPEGLRTPRMIEDQYLSDHRKVIERLMESPRLQATMKAADDFPYEEMVDADPQDWSPELIEKAKDHLSQEARLEDLADMIRKDDTLFEDIFGKFSARRTAHLGTFLDDNRFGHMHRPLEALVNMTQYTRQRGHTRTQTVLRGMSEEDKRAVYMLNQMNPFYIKESSFNDLAQSLAYKMEDAGADGASLKQQFEANDAVKRLLRTFVGDLGEDLDWKAFVPGTPADELMEQGLPGELERLFRMKRDEVKPGSFRQLPVESPYRDMDAVEMVTRQSEMYEIGDLINQYGTDDAGYIWRGVSQDELDSIRKTGKIQSIGTNNLEDQATGSTYFATDPASAIGYAVEVNRDKRAYLLRIRQPSKLARTSDRILGEVGYAEPISSNNIVDTFEVYRGERMSPDNVDPGVAALLGDDLPKTTIRKVGTADEDIKFSLRERPDEDTLEIMRDSITKQVRESGQARVRFESPVEGIKPETVVIDDVDKIDEEFARIGVTPWANEMLSKDSVWLGLDTRSKVEWALRQTGELPEDTAKRDELISSVLGDRKAGYPGMDIREVDIDALPPRTRKLFKAESDVHRFFEDKKQQARTFLQDISREIGQTPEELSSMVGDLGEGYWPQRTALVSKVFRDSVEHGVRPVQSFMHKATHARPVEHLVINSEGMSGLSHNIGDMGRVMQDYNSEVANLHLYLELMRFAKKYGVHSEFNISSAAAGWFPLSKIKPPTGVATKAARSGTAGMEKTEDAVQNALDKAKTMSPADDDVANMLLQEALDASDEDNIIPGIGNYLLPKGVERFLSHHLSGGVFNEENLFIGGKTQSYYRAGMSVPRRMALSTVPWLAANAIDQVMSFALAGPQKLDKYLVGAQVAIGAYADDMARELRVSAPRTWFEAFKTKQAKYIQRMLNGIAGGKKYEGIRSQIMQELQSGYVGGEGWARHMQHGAEYTFDFMSPQQPSRKLQSDNAAVRGVGHAAEAGKYAARQAESFMSLAVRLGGGMEDMARKLQYSAMRLQGMSPMDAQDALAKGFVNYNSTSLSAFDEVAKDMMYFWTYWKQRPEQLMSAMAQKPWIAWNTWKLRSVVQEHEVQDEQDKILLRGAPDYIRQQPDYVPVSWDRYPLKMVADDFNKEYGEGSIQEYLPFIRMRLSPVETVGDMRNTLAIDEFIEDGSSNLIYRLFARSSPLAQAVSDFARGDRIGSAKDLVPWIATGGKIDNISTPYYDKKGDLNVSEKELNETRRMFRAPLIDKDNPRRDEIDEKLWRLRQWKSKMEALGFITHFERKQFLAHHLDRDSLVELNRIRREKGYSPIVPESRQKREWGYGLGFYPTYKSEQ